jgi:LL-diaminopimelate aminotransferase
MITHNLISTVPWDEAGAHVRFSVTFAAADAAEEKRVIAAMEKRLSRYTLEW